MASTDDATNKQLDVLPTSPGQSKCIHLAGNTRICRVLTVLGSSLAGNPQVRRRCPCDSLGAAQPLCVTPVCTCCHV